jgi:hypothetical protein
MIFLASCCAVGLASSMLSCIVRHRFGFGLCSVLLSIASSADKPDITSSCCNWLLCLSTSTCLLSRLSILAVYSAAFVSKSSFTFLTDNSLFGTPCLLILFSTSATFLSLRITCSCSDFNSINFLYLKNFIFFCFQLQGWRLLK